MTLVEKLLLLAVVVQVALTFGLLLWLGQVRVPLITSGSIKMRDIALGGEGWPPKARQLANAVDNQFQLPVLFYVAVLVTLWSARASWLELILAWAFVVLRCVHAFIHATDNDVAHRFFAYAAGFFVLVAYWIVLAVRLLLVTG
jgi:hypothetical protein